MLTVMVDGYTVDHRGKPPFVARSASDQTDEWPYWYVCGVDKINWMFIREGAGSFASKFAARELAIKIANALNEAA